MYEITNFLVGVRDKNNYVVKRFLDWMLEREGYLNGIVLLLEKQEETNLTAIREAVKKAIRYDNLELMEYLLYHTYDRFKYYNYNFILKYAKDNSTPEMVKLIEEFEK